jgi:hypothetical protein
MRTRPAPRAARLALGLSLATLTMAAADVSAMSFIRVVDVNNPVTADPGHANPHYFGAAWADYDQDGDIDLFVDINSFYRNDGAGQFTKITGSGLGAGQIASAAFSMCGWSWGDYDRDGDPDAFIAGERSFLYRNEGNDTFSQITTGDIGDGFGNRGWTCAWGDYDNDGNLDLVIVHPAGFVPGGPALPNQMFHGDGAPDHTFTELFEGPIVTGLDSYTVGTWADFEGDGDLDFSIGAGPASAVQQPDFLYRNLLVESGSADFERITEAPIATDNQDGQVWNWIDYDNDGDLDAYVTNWGGAVGGLRNRLYRQEPNGSFTGITGQPITDEVSASLASVWEDFDNDGDLDCYVSNDGARRDFLYENQGGGVFTSVTTTPITVATTPRRGACAGDYDNDGDVDLFVNGPAGSRALYRNEDATPNAFISIRLIGTVSNPTAIGAKVRLLATIDGVPTWQRRDVSAQNSFNGHSDQRLHFGLGDATGVDSIRIEWPSGLISAIGSVEANQYVTFIEGATSDVDPIAPGTGLLMQTSPNPFTGRNEIRGQAPSGVTVSLKVHDVAGRLIRVLTTSIQDDAQFTSEWDGTDSHGRDVPDGVYLYRLDAGTQSLTGRVTRIR